MHSSLARIHRKRAIAHCSVGNNEVSSCAQDTDGKYRSNRHQVLHLRNNLSSSQLEHGGVRSARRLKLYGPANSEHLTYLVESDHVPVSTCADSDMSHTGRSGLQPHNDLRTFMVKHAAVDPAVFAVEEKSEVHPVLLEGGRNSQCELARVSSCPADCLIKVPSFTSSGHPRPLCRRPRPVLVEDGNHKSVMPDASI